MKYKINVFCFFLTSLFFFNSLYAISNKPSSKILVKKGSPMINLKSRINEVTVFSDRAQITRIATEKLVKGEHVLLFGNLPEVIEQNSINVKGIGNAILKDVKFKTVYFAEVPDKDRKALFNEKRKLEDSLKALNDKINVANNEKSFIEKIAVKLTTVTEKSDSTELDPEKWIKMVEFYRSKLEDLDREIRRTEQEKTSIQNQLNKVIQQINEIGHQKQKEKNQVEVIVEMKKEGSLGLSLSYIVYGPGWYPVYDLRVSTDEKKMNITYNAMIQQNTTEDWDDVQVKLSTAQPNISGHQPNLEPWHINIFQPTSRPYSKKRSKSEDKNLRAQMFNVMPDESALESELLKDEAEESMEKIEARVETKATSVVFAISGSNTIKSDNLPHKVTIMIENFPAYFRYSTVPKLMPYAHLKAKVKNQTEYPFLAGQTNVFLDNSFVANSKIKLVAPSEEFWTFLGVDEGMKVEYKFLKKYYKNEGFLGKKNKLIYEYLILIKNNKKTEEELVVWDQIPISGHQDIVVKLIEPAYKEDSPTLKKNEHDFLEWFFKPKPGEEIKIPFKFSVEYPQNMRIDGLD